jgi:hypothetical protein
MHNHLSQITSASSSNSQATLNPNPLLFLSIHYPATAFLLVA